MRTNKIGDLVWLIYGHTVEANLKSCRMSFALNMDMSDFGAAGMIIMGVRDGLLADWPGRPPVACCACPPAGPTVPAGPTPVGPTGDSLDVAEGTDKS